MGFRGFLLYALRWLKEYVVVRRGLSIAVIVALMTGCAASHTPSIMVMPHGNASYADFQADDTACQQYAETRAREASRRESNKSFGHALLLGLLGAAAGASYGSGWGMSGYGARVGTTYGLTSGLAYGAGKEEAVGQRAFDLTYAQCMRTKGHKLPGFQSIDDQPVQASIPAQPVQASPVIKTPVVERSSVTPPAATPPAGARQSVPPQVERQPVAPLPQQERNVTADVVQLQARYNASRLFLRPDVGAERLSMVSSGVNLKIIENRDTWLFVETPPPDEKRGWILKEWIQN